ncbi:MAG: hypothetical protein KDA22_03935 [Phycisphaerales bacterium]|nr:hypothetical protein [Phycisphaerales bacterium]
METMLWKRDEASGLVLYREIGGEAGHVVIREGRLGEPGEIRRRPVAAGVAGPDAVEAEIDAASEEGFVEADEFGEELMQLAIPRDSQTGTGDDGAIERFADQLGLALEAGGIGSCQGLEIGDDLVILHCFVVDQGEAERVMEALLAESPFKDGAFIAEDDLDSRTDARN